MAALEPAPVPDYSVIITCYHEERSIDEFAERLLNVIAMHERTFEIVFVDDGSTDATHEKLLAIYQRSNVVRSVLRLFANSGQAAAITAGLSVARGRHIVLLDSDLQLDPEDLPKLVARFEDGNDVVSGVRVGRKDPFRRKLYSRIANGIMRRASGAAFTDFGCTFKIFDGRLIRAFNLGPTRVFRLIELLSQAGRWAEVPVAHHVRRYGSSGWTLRRLLDLNTDNLLMMTRRPFQYLAVVATVASMLLALRILLDFVTPVRLLGEVTTGLLLNAIIVSLLVVCAIQALIGELVIRSFHALAGAPAYIIKEAAIRD